MTLQERAERVRGDLAKAGRRHARSAKTLDARAAQVRLALDPDMAAYKAELDDRAAKDAWARGAKRHELGAGRASGWNEQPQCEACKRIKSNPEAICDGCGFLPGAGYMAVPAKESYLDRWR